jgi:predicted  nucleic acid-binding Zn-ribbon protein
MWKKTLLFLLFAYCLPCAVPAAEAEQWYYITENQLRSIEQSVEQLETDRQSWESQARGLRNEAANLNAQLQEERENYSALETSFNRYETSQSEARSIQEAELWKERFQKKGIETQRNIAALTAAALLALLILHIRFKVP